MPGLRKSGPVDCTVKYNYDHYPDTQEHPSRVCLSTGNVVGLVFQALAGFLSLFALLLLLCTILGRYRRRLLKPPPEPQGLLFRGNIDILILNLIFADIWVSTGSLPNIYWASKRQVYCGSVCNLQGFVQTIGETAAAFATMLVTVYTFLVLYTNQHRTFKPELWLSIILATWLWAGVWAIIPIGAFSKLEPDEHGARLYYTPTPWWCWINGRHMSIRVVAEYWWLWSAVVSTIALCVPSYLMVRKKRKNIDPIGEAQGHSDASIQRNRDLAKVFCYPVAYTLCILPVTITRWITSTSPSLLSNSSTGPVSMAFGAVFYLTGFLHATLTLWIKPGILLLGSDDQPSPGDMAEAPIIHQLQHTSRPAEFEFDCQGKATSRFSGSSVSGGG